jgi:outer membrane protein OmpA-like peptidoglycan-associated protein
MRCGPTPKEVIAMAHARLFSALVVAATVLLIVGCATKKFVREEIGQSEARTGEAVGQVGGALTQEQARVETLTGQVSAAGKRTDAAAALAGTATQRADQAGQKAEQAGGVATQALARAGETDARLSRLWADRYKRSLGATVTVLFAFDRWNLDDRAETALLDVVRVLQENPNVVVDLEGYTDNVGPGPYNITLSERRAEAVRRFLVEKGVDVQRIQSIGLGIFRPIADNKTKEGRDQNRRVVVKLFNPATE